MGRIIRHDEAEQDLFETWFFLAQESSVERAESFLDQIETTLSTLATHPYMGRSRSDLLPGMRSFPVGAYLVFYLPHADGGGIDLLRVLDSRRDVDALFEGGES